MLAVLTITVIISVILVLAVLINIDDTLEKIEENTRAAADEAHDIRKLLTEEVKKS